MRAAGLAVFLVDSKSKHEQSLGMRCEIRIHGPGPTIHPMGASSTRGLVFDLRPPSRFLRVQDFLPAFNPPTVYALVHDLAEDLSLMYL